METYQQPQHGEIRGEPAAPATGGVAGGLGALQQLQAFVLRRLQALTALTALTLFLFWGCLGGLAALRRMIELEAGPLLQAAVFSLLRGCSGGVGALRKLVEPEDRRLRAATFFLTFGSSMVLYGTAVNRSVNPEHLFAGFFLFTIGGVMAILTIAGGGAGRAADGMESFLRGFF